MRKWNKLCQNAAVRLDLGRGLGAGSRWAALSSEVRRAELAKQREIETGWTTPVSTSRPTIDHGHCPDDIHLRRIRRENKEELARLNNKQTNNPEGFVYVETNPAWPDYVKVGCALDWQDRLNGMQTGSPHRDYAMPYRKYFKDREAAEKVAHADLKAWRVGRTEWFATTVEHARGVIQSIHLGNECKEAA